MTSLSEFKNHETRQLTTFDLSKKSKTLPVRRGETLSLPEVRGCGCITQFWITFPGWFWQHWDRTAPVSQTLLKTLLIRIFWDGETRPAVEVPVGDFFGNGLCEISNFTSRYFGMSSGGFFCKFPMPFQKGFRIEFENRDEHVDTDVFVNVLYQLTDTPAENHAYFHTHFHTGANAGPDPVTILDAHGRGHYVGCTLSMQAKEPYYLSYLEAPEYVCIDDDWEVPRITGTGLEDYFLGGWYFREGLFTGELHGVPAKDDLHSGITMYRAHDADAIRFKKRIRFQFVNPWSPGRLKPFVHSSAAFFYLDSPAGQGPGIPDRKNLLCWHHINDTDHISVP